MSNSVVVTTEEELRVACERKVEHILIKGDLAKTVEKNMKQRKTRKKFMIGSVAIAGLGFIAAPFTGGASIPKFVLRNHHGLEDIHRFFAHHLILWDNLMPDLYRSDHQGGYRKESG